MEATGRTVGVQRTENDKIEKDIEKNVYKLAKNKNLKKNEQ